MDLVTTIPGRSYETPTRFELERAARFYGLPLLHPMLLRDVANLISGGNVSEEEFQKLPKSDINDKYFSAIKGLEGHPNILNPDSIPGLTPLAKAINFIYSLGESPAQAAMMAGGGPGDPNNMPNMFDEGNHGGEGEKMEGPDSGSPEGSGPSFDAETEYERINDIINADDIIKKVNHLLKKTPSFELSRRRKLIPDAFGNTRRTRGIEEISEIPKLNQTDLADMGSAYGLSRIITGEAQIKEWCKEELPKKRYYLLFDASASMKDEKISKALGVFFALMQRVLKNDVVVDFAFFATQANEFIEISDAASVNKTAKYAMSCSFNGGGTNITASLNNVFDHMDKLLKGKKELVVKDIVIITDGEDSSTKGLTTSHFRNKNARLHYVEVQSGEIGGHKKMYNPSLNAIALETGGFSASY